MLDTMSSKGHAKNKRQLDTLSSRNSIGRILDTALTLMTKRGDASVTMAQIAKAARVSRQAVYLHFADRAALMVAIARHVDERLGLPTEIQRLFEAPNGVAMLDAMVSLQAGRNPAIWAVARGLDAIRRTDAAAERAWQDRLNARLEGCRAIIARLQSDGTLRPDLDPAIAADLLWTITSLRTWEDLVLERGWSPERYTQQIARLLRKTLTSSRPD
jgi:AcrR family transcriptional regulator